MQSGIILYRIKNGCEEGVVEMDRIQEEYLRMPVVKQIADAQEMGWVNPGLLP